MLQLSITQFVTIAVIIFTWTITSLCACRIIDDLVEKIKEIKQELAELKKHTELKGFVEPTEAHACNAEHEKYE
jgi:hypothetical protein